MNETRAEEADDLSEELFALAKHCFETGQTNGEICGMMYIFIKQKYPQLGSNPNLTRMIAKNISQMRKLWKADRNANKSLNTRTTDDSEDGSEIGEGGGEA